MPNSICPRNSIFQRLPLNWGENIPRYFLSCSRVLNAIMLSFPMSVSFVVFCQWLFYHIQQLEPIFRLFHFPKLISPNKTRPDMAFRGQKPGIFQFHRDYRVGPEIFFIHDVPAIADKILKRSEAGAVHALRPLSRLMMNGDYITR